MSKTNLGRQFFSSRSPSLIIFNLLRIHFDPKGKRKTMNITPTKSSYAVTVRIVRGSSSLLLPRRLVRTIIFRTGVASRNLLSRTFGSYTLTLHPRVSMNDCVHTTQHWLFFFFLPTLSSSRRRSTFDNTRKTKI